MADGYATPRERKEAHPTLEAYCAAQTHEGLARLIWDHAHQFNVFSTYSGTVGDHAMTMIAVLTSLKGRLSPVGWVHQMPDRDIGVRTSFIQFLPSGNVEWMKAYVLFTPTSAKGNADG
jgi:hypothetical protein